MHKIEFYKIDREKIPTGLRLLVDDEIQVAYERLHDKFGYHFEINKPMDEEYARGIIDDIVRMMEIQSYDHGAEWVVTDIETKVEDLFGMMFYKFNVLFRIKDIY